MSARFALTVRFEVAEPDRAGFLKAVRSNAARSVVEEPGCLRFDVLTLPDDPAEVWLYEIYRDRAAFDAHLGTDHYVQFDAETRPMVRRKVVRFHGLTENCKS